MCIHIHIHSTGRGHYFSLLFYLLFICQPFNPSPSAGRGCGVKDQLFSPPYTLFIFLSRIGSALPHRVNSRQQVDYVVYSRSHSFHGGNQTTNKNPTYLESNHRLSHLRVTVGLLHHRHAATIPPLTLK